MVVYINTNSIPIPLISKLKKKKKILVKSFNSNIKNASSL